MTDAARILMDERDWWRRIDDEQHGALTEAVHELSDEAARTLQYLALLCGAIARDAGWDEDSAQALAASLRERVACD